MTTVPCFYTTVQSLAPSERSFGFLGAHGKRLAPYEQFTQPGNLIDSLAARATGPEGSSRHFNALEAAVASGALAIVATPAVHLYDDTRDWTKVLQVDNNVLGVVDPCWGAFSSSMAAPG